MTTTKVFLPQSHSFHRQMSQTLPFPGNSTGVHLILEGEDSGTFYRVYPAPMIKLTSSLNCLTERSSAALTQRRKLEMAQKGNHREPPPAQLKSCSGNNTLKLFISISHCLDRRAQPPVIEDLFKPGVSWPMNHPTLRWVLNSTLAFSKHLNEFGGAFLNDGYQKKSLTIAYREWEINQTTPNRKANSKEKIKDCFRARQKFS